MSKASNGSHFGNTAQFLREKHLVDLFFARLGQCVPDCTDPKTLYDYETGVDVLANQAGLKIGIQVTELDTGEVQGELRAAEKNALREATLSTYCAPAQNNPSTLHAAIKRAISRKVEISRKHNFSEFQEVWLLISAGIPEMGSVTSTLLITQWLKPETLQADTSGYLSQSKYKSAYIHCIHGTERALYSWNSRNNQWQKSIQEEPSGPSFWDIQHLIKRRQ